MSEAVRRLLDAFDALPEADKHQAAVEILRRFGSVEAGDLPEEALTEAADDLFCCLDAEETGHTRG